MKKIILFLRKLFGYHYKSYLFKGYMLGDAERHSIITVSIENTTIPSPDDFFKSSVICWERDPLKIRVHKQSHFLFRDLFPGYSIREGHSKLFTTIK